MGRAHGPTDSPSPSCPPCTWILGCGLEAPAPPPPPVGGGGVQLGPTPSPPPRPAHSPSSPRLGPTPHLRRSPPLLADSAMLLGGLWSLPSAVGRLCWGRGRSQPSDLCRAPLCRVRVSGPNPQENSKAVAGGSRWAQEDHLPETRPHLSGQGHQSSRPQGLGVAGKGPAGEGHGGQRTRASCTTPCPGT